MEVKKVDELQKIYGELDEDGKKMMAFILEQYSNCETELTEQEIEEIFDKL